MPAGDAAQMLELAEDFDAVVTDLQMRGLDGIQVCERIRADPEIAHIPVVLLTARGQQSDLEAGRRAGCRSWLPKGRPARSWRENMAGSGWRCWGWRRRRSGWH